MREKRKEVVKAVESALEEVERAVGEAVGKKLSLTAPVTEEPIKGYDMDTSDHILWRPAVPLYEPARGWRLCTYPI